MGTSNSKDSSSVKTSSKKDGDDKYKHASRITKYIVIAIILLLGGNMIIKIINAFFNNPVADGLSTALGSAARGFTQLMNGCCSKADCKSDDAEGSCNSSCGCTWDSSENACVSTDSRSIGEGGLMSADCFMFWGGLFWLASLIIAPTIGFFIKRFGTKTDNAKTLEQLKGESWDDLVNDMSDRLNGDLDDFRDWMDKTKGRKPTTEEEKMFTKKAGVRETNNDIQKVANDKPGDENIQNQAKKAQENAEQQEKEIEDDSDLSDDSKNDVNDGVDEIVPEVPIE
jgi:hypothetical protein